MSVHKGWKKCYLRVKVNIVGKKANFIHYFFLLSFKNNCNTLGSGAFMKILIYIIMSFGHQHCEESHLYNLSISSPKWVRCGLVTL